MSLFDVSPIEPSAAMRADEREAVHVLFTQMSFKRFLMLEGKKASEAFKHV